MGEAYLNTPRLPWDPCRSSLICLNGSVSYVGPSFWANDSEVVGHVSILRDPQTRQEIVGEMQGLPEQSQGTDGLLRTLGIGLSVMPVQSPSLGSEVFFLQRAPQGQLILSPKMPRITGWVAPTTGLLGSVFTFVGLANAGYFVCAGLDQELNPRLPLEVVERIPVTHEAPREETPNIEERADEIVRGGLLIATHGRSLKDVAREMAEREELQSKLIDLWNEIQQLKDIGLGYLTWSLEQEMAEFSAVFSARWSGSSASLEPVASAAGNPKGSGGSAETGMSARTQRLLGKWDKLSAASQADPTMRFGEVVEVSVTIDGRLFAGRKILPGTKTAWGRFAQEVFLHGGTSVYYLPDLVVRNPRLGPTAFHDPAHKLVAVSHSAMDLGGPGPEEAHELRHAQLLHASDVSENIFSGRFVPSMAPTQSLSEASAFPLGVAHALTQALLLPQNPTQEDLDRWRRSLRAIAPLKGDGPSLQSSAIWMAAAFVSVLQGLTYQSGNSATQTVWREKDGVSYLEVLGDQGQPLVALMLVVDGITGALSLGVSFHENHAHNEALLLIFPSNSVAPELIEALRNTESSLDIELVREMLRDQVDPRLHELLNRARQQIRLYLELDQELNRLATLVEPVAQALKAGRPALPADVESVNQKMRGLRTLGDQVRQLGLNPGEEVAPWMIHGSADPKK